jgi:hypothetical protein
MLLFRRLDHGSQHEGGLGGQNAWSHARTALWWVYQDKIKEVRSLRELLAQSEVEVVFPPVAQGHCYDALWHISALSHRIPRLAGYGAVHHATVVETPRPSIGNCYRLHVRRPSLDCKGDSFVESGE